MTSLTSDSLAERRPLVAWQDLQGQAVQSHWHSESAAAPQRLVAVDDQLSADKAYRMACAGIALVWQGDYHNARQLVQALTRRLDKPSHKARAKARQRAEPDTTQQAFHLHRQAQGQRARVLGAVLVPVTVDAQGLYRVSLRRAPDIAQACQDAWGPSADSAPILLPLRELLGIIGAHEWRKKGVPIPALGKDIPHIHAHYGVFSPVRGEYLDLLANAAWPQEQTPALAFDIGTGTGVIAALLLRRGVPRVVGTDCSPRALTCAQDNLQRLGLMNRVALEQVDLFPQGQAPLIVCNPPWLPARATSVLEQAVYDEDSRMLQGFLSGVAAHLLPQGQAWLILSDLAEHLGLRSRETLMEWIDAAGLRLLGVEWVKPTHGKAQDAKDPLHAARAAERTGLWRLAHKEAATPAV